MVEISNNKKNIIILFIIMIIILFFIYKGFIADNSHYLEEYKNYLISINASEYYFKQTEKNKKIKSYNKEKNELENAINILMYIKETINNSINNIVLNNLTIYNNTNINELNKVITNLSRANENIDKIDEIIVKYIKQKYDK